MKLGSRALMLSVLIIPIAIVLWPYSPDRTVDKRLSGILDTYYENQIGVPRSIKVDLSEVTDFDWDTVHVLGHYSGCIEVLKVVGPWVHACKMVGNDFFHILVFELSGSVVRYSQVKGLVPGPGVNVISLSNQQAKLEAVSWLALESEYWPKVREGLYVRWLIPAGHGELYCTACVEQSRRQNRCKSFRKNNYCDLTEDYSLRVVTPKLNSELYRIANQQKVSGA